MQSGAFSFKIHVYRHGIDERVSTISFHENVSTSDGLQRQLCTAFGAENATQLAVVVEDDDGDAGSDAGEEEEEEEDEDAGEEDQAPPTVMDAVDVCDAIARNAKGFFGAPPVGKAYDETSLAFSIVCSNGAKDAKAARGSASADERKRINKGDPDVSWRIPLED